MNSQSATRRASHVSLRLALAALSALLAGAGARSQLDPGASYRKMLDSRMERSQRAVEETQRRRFEEGKLTSDFPSDARRRAEAKPGVLRAVTPEERRALEHNERGLALHGSGRFEQAIKEYREAVRAYPPLAAAHNNMGSALFALARYEEAAAAFRHAAGLDPKYGQAHFNLALAYVRLGLEKEANDALMGAAHAYVAAGDEHYENGRLAEAEESYKALLQIDPDYYPAFLRLGIVYNAARRYPEAVEMLTRLASLRPDSADAYENIGEALRGMGKYAEAAQSAERATRLDPASAGAHYIAGVSRADLGEREKALACLARLTELKAEQYARRLAEYIEKKAPRRQ